MITIKKGHIYHLLLNTLVFICYEWVIAAEADWDNGPSRIILLVILLFANFFLGLEWSTNNSFKKPFNFKKENDG